MLLPQRKIPTDWPATAIAKLRFSVGKWKIKANLSFVRPVTGQSVGIFVWGNKKYYIADFYCSKAKLVIEVDGGYHLRIKDEDANRDEVVKSLGLKTIRFTNEQVLNDLPKVLIIIEETLTPSNV